MHKYVVKGVERITPTTLLLSLLTEKSGSTFSFQPGEYAAINYYRNRRPSAVRCFSIVSSPTEQGILQFSMRTKGHYTKALMKLRPGDKIDVRGPFGGFVFNAQRDKRTVFIAGGIGITPFMSMVRYATATNAANDIDLIYSCRTQDDVPFLAELIRLQAANPHFSTTFVIGNGPVYKLAGQRVALGRISPELLGRVTPADLLAGTTFLICGPSSFMRAMSVALRQRGVQSHNILSEAFSQGPNRQTGKVKNWPVNMYILTAAGMAVSSFVVMAADLLKTLPPSSIFGTNNNVTKETLTNSRQVDLNSLINSLPTRASDAPASDAVNKALAAANVPASIQQQKTSSAVPQTTTTTTPKVSTAPAPKPVHVPVCTTSQSGVTTCV